VGTLNVKELVRQHWNRRAAEFDLEASHGPSPTRRRAPWRRIVASRARHRSTCSTLAAAPGSSLYLRAGYFAFEFVAKLLWPISRIGRLFWKEKSN
jgi:hypothetical protein